MIDLPGYTAYVSERFTTRPWKAIRDDMVPEAESGLKTGHAYASRVIEFVHDNASGWRPEIAAQNSPSLGKFLQAMQKLKLSASTLYPRN
jgi:hypothetical protein